MPSILKLLRVVLLLGWFVTFAHAVGWLHHYTVVLKRGTGPSKRHRRAASFASILLFGPRVTIEIHSTRWIRVCKHSDIIHFCLVILVCHSQASWACALQRRVVDFLDTTGPWERLDVLTWQVNAELLITGLDVYYNPDSRCKARPFTSQHVLRDVFS